VLTEEEEEEVLPHWKWTSWIKEK